MMHLRTASTKLNSATTKVVSPYIIRSLSSATIPKNTPDNNDDEGASKATSKKKSHPKLTEVPSLPFIGSMFSPYSGAPAFDPSKLYDYHPEMRKRFGDFYSFGAPGFGSGLHGTAYATIDPNEYMPILRNEGSYPHGAVESLWPIRKGLKEVDSALVQDEDYGLFDHGENWQRQRRFLQTGMLCPKAARGFVPGIAHAARLASRGAPANRRDVTKFLNHCAFDMFCTFMFGELTRVADPNSERTETTTDPRNIQFCEASIEALNLSIQLVQTPYELFMGNILNIPTRKYKRFQRAFQTVREIGMDKIHSFYERYQTDQLDDLERASYLAKAIERQSQPDSNVTKDEMFDLCFISLFVSVDTTTSVLSWILLHLALNPHVQEQLHRELSEAAIDGQLTAESIQKSKSPYLHAVIRESHRITPPGPSSLVKRSKTQLTIHDVTLPPNSLILLAHANKDPRYVTDPDRFVPERWFPDAVRRRMRTESEVIDHPLFRDPFSQGARRCPGSRVANNEIMVLIAQLVLDWKIATKDVKRLEEVEYEQAVFLQPIFPTLEFEPRSDGV